MNIALIFYLVGGGLGLIGAVIVFVWANHSPMRGKRVRR